MTYRRPSKWDDLLSKLEDGHTHQIPNEMRRDYATDSNMLLALRSVAKHRGLKLRAYRDSTEHGLRWFVYVMEQ